MVLHTLQRPTSGSRKKNKPLDRASKTTKMYTCRPNPTSKGHKMKKNRNDYTICPNTQRNREGQGLWNVMAGRVDLVSIERSEKEAQDMADRLNADSYALERNQTRLDRWGS
jgi:hypothetical protein